MSDSGINISDEEKGLKATVDIAQTGGNNTVSIGENHQEKDHNEINSGVEIENQLKEENLISDRVTDAVNQYVSRFIIKKDEIAKSLTFREVLTEISFTDVVVLIAQFVLLFGGFNILQPTNNYNSNMLLILASVLLLSKNFSGIKKRKLFKKLEDFAKMK